LGRYIYKNSTFTVSDIKFNSLGFTININGFQATGSLILIPGNPDSSHLQWDAVRADLTQAQRAALPASKQLEINLERIRLAAKKNKIQWLGGGPPGATPQQEIDQGRRMGPATEERAHADRLYTKRKMPY